MAGPQLWGARNTTQLWHGSVCLSPRPALVFANAFDPLVDLLYSAQVELRVHAHNFPTLGARGLVNFLRSRLLR